jgi:hypothetical protein
MEDRTAAMSHNDRNDNDERKPNPFDKPAAAAAAATVTSSASVGLSSEARKEPAVQTGLPSDPFLDQAASPGSTNLPAPRHPGVSSHNRQVSWDRKLVVEGHPTTTYSPNTASYSPVPEGILHPIPEGLQPISEDILQPTLTGGSSSTAFRSLNLSLEDIVQQTPYEAEAETYILKVLEQRDPTYSPQSHRSSRFSNNDTNSSTASASVLGHVPEVGHNFSMTEEEFTPVNDYDDDDINKEQTSVGSNNQSEISATTSHSRGRRQQQQQQQQQPTGRTSHIWDNSHNQNRSVEETLFGLTSALQAMNTLADTPLNPATAWDAAGMEYNNITNMNTHHRRTGSSAEQLAVNASLLFQRKKNDAHTPDDNISVVSGGGSDIDGSIGNKSSLESAPPSPNSGGRWTALRTVVSGGRRRSDSNAHDSTSTQTPAFQEEIPEGDEEEGGLSDIEPDDEPLQGDESTAKKPPEKTKRKARMSFAAHIKEEWDYVNRFQHFRNVTRNPLASAIYVYCKVVLLYLILPSTGIAAILFHLADNPPTGYDVPETTSGAAVHSSTASASWWLLFLGVRQVITFSLAMGTELIVIDWLSIRVRGTLRVFGPWITLMIVQSKGWPFLIFAWGLFDFCLLYGDHRFYQHWLFWQDTLEMFTEKNPAGQVIFSDTYRRILTVAVSVGIVVAIKRFWLALFLGKQTFGEWYLWFVRS